MSRLNPLIMFSNFLINMTKYFSSSNRIQQLQQLTLQQEINPGFSVMDGTEFSLNVLALDLIIYLVHIIDNKELNKSVYPGNKIPTYDEE